MILIKAGQDVKEAIEVMPLSLIFSKIRIELQFASDHLHNLFWLLLLDGVLSPFTLVTLQHVEITNILQIIENVVDGIHYLNLEDKVLN